MFKKRKGLWRPDLQYENDNCKNVSKRRGKFAAFMDHKKAYDRIDREAV